MNSIGYLLVDWLYFNSVAMCTFRSEIITIPFRFWLHYLVFSQRKRTMSHQDSTIHEWNWWLCEWTHAYVRVNCQMLTEENQIIWMVSCVFTSVVFCLKHGRKVSWISLNAVYLNSFAMCTISQVKVWVGKTGLVPVFGINTARDISKLSLR